LESSNQYAIEAIILQSVGGTYSNNVDTPIDRHKW